MSTAENYPSVRSSVLWFNFLGASEREAKRIRLMIVGSIITTTLPRFPAGPAVLGPLTDDTGPCVETFVPAIVQRAESYVPAICLISPRGRITVKTNDGSPGGDVLPLCVSWVCRNFEKIFQDCVEKSCAICFEAPSDIVLEPCRHAYTCAKCASLLRTCPICRAVIVGRVPRSPAGV